MRTRGRGFTIPEMLVVAFLGAVVLFLIAQILVPSLLLFRLESARSDVQQQSLLLVQRLQRQLMNSTLESVTLVEDPPAIAFQEVPETDSFDLSNGRPRISDYYVIYWYDAETRRVFSKTWKQPGPPALSGYPSTDPYEPRPLKDGHVKAIILQKNDTERVVAREVDSVVFSDDDGDISILHPPLQIIVTCSADASGAGHDRREFYTMSSRVVCRNGRW